MAATNRPTEELRRTGAFREDFYYRLCADCIQMPSLAQRIEENPDELTELVEHFSVLITGQDIPELSEKVLDVIQKRLGKDYPWPGNVRELAQCIRRVILKEDYQPQVPRPTTQIQTFLQGVQQAELFRGRAAEPVLSMAVYEISLVSGCRTNHGHRLAHR